ncbi:hypothetical protein CLG94_00595 [Candidatus Methylomirabilis limnetica]|uniref:DUF4268 domain-containing protein n=2 Tax=Candidatus Methylomirabilis limnetica TaxID=2033718 RepID=A0A2T4U119_9BACT|nr:hypothetical protein CLG94_00595 [Candidatus Methylomirabilis limnetica]
MCQPNEVVRATPAAKSSGALTEIQQMQLECWTMFRDRLLEKKVLLLVQTPGPQYWLEIALGRSNIFLSNILDTYAGRIGIRIYRGNRIAEAALAQLEKDKDAIEKEIGEKLSWNPTPEKRDKIIGLFRNADVSNRDAWPEYCDWLVDCVGEFHQACVWRIKALT